MGCLSSIKQEKKDKNEIQSLLKLPGAIEYRKVAFQILDKDIFSVKAQAIIHPIVVDSEQKPRSLPATKFGARLAEEAGKEFVEQYQTKIFAK